MGDWARREPRLVSGCQAPPGACGMAVADDLEIEIMFGLGMTVAWVERHGEIQLVEWVPSFDQ